MNFCAKTYLYSTDHPQINGQLNTEMQISPSSFYSPKAPLSPKIFTLDRKLVGEKIRNIRTRKATSKAKNTNFTNERPIKNRRMISPSPLAGQFFMSNKKSRKQREYFSPLQHDKQRYYFRIILKPNIFFHFLCNIAILEI